MIAVFRVRFTGTPATAVWDDTKMHNWMNPTIQYSLAHFWRRTSLFQADMRYTQYPPILMDDPRSNAPNGANLRAILVDSVLKEATKQYSPDWGSFDRAFIWFAQATDLFGGGSHAVPLGSGLTKNIPAAVFDVYSAFDQIVQEVGHTFGLQHEVDGAGNDYQSPYSTMSSETYGGQYPTFTRDSVAELPVGGRRDDLAVADAQIEIGPYITPVQFCNSNMGTFSDSATVLRVPASYASLPFTFTLTALDEGINVWPYREHILAVLPPLVPNGDTYFLELRNNAGYDGGLKPDTSDGGVPVAVVIHAVNPTTGRVRYVTRIPLNDPLGDRDYHSFSGFFVVRINSYSSDWCKITVGGGDFWKQLGVVFENVLTSPALTRLGDWANIVTSPCPSFPDKPYQYRFKYFATKIRATATSYGYEKPGYQWYLNDRALDPSFGSITVVMDTKLPENGSFSTSQKQNITVSFKIAANTITLTVDAEFGAIGAVLRVDASETSAEVIKNNYPDRSVWTDIIFDNVQLEWGSEYLHDQGECIRERILALKSELMNPNPFPNPNPEPGWGWGVSLATVVNILTESNPVAANAVIKTIAALTNASPLEVIQRIQSGKTETNKRQLDSPPRRQ